MRKILQLTFNNEYIDHRNRQEQHKIQQTSHFDLKKKAKLTRFRLK